MIDIGNIFAELPPPGGDEHVALLARWPGARIERIVSQGQASPPGYWYDQSETEWVLLLAGSAGLWLEGEAAPRILRPGDHLEIPPHLRHRVEWTDAAEPTIWLAVHAAP